MVEARLLCSMLLCSSKAVSFDGSAPTIVWGSGSPPRVLGKAAAEFVPGRLRSRPNRDASGSHPPLSSLLRPFPLCSCRTGLIERCPHVTGALNLRTSPPVSSPCLLLSAGRGIASAHRTSALLRIGARAPPYSPLCDVRLFLVGRAISCAR